MAISNVTDWDEIEADPDFPSLSQESRAKLFDDWEKKFSRTLLEGADLDKVKPEGLNRLAATNAVRRRKLAGEDVSDLNVAAKTWSEQKQAEAKLAQQALKDYADVEDKKFRLDDARSMPGVDELGRAAPWWEEGVAKATKDLESAEAKLVPEVRAQAQAASEALKGKRKIATLNGNIYTDPALVLNKDEFRQQVLDSDAPPEAKALKLASFQSEKKRYLDEAINTLTKGDPLIPLAESFPKFLESKGFDLDQEMAKQSEGKLDYSPIQKQRELAQEYLTKMQDRGWFRKIGSAISTGVATGMLDIGTQAAGTAAMLTGKAGNRVFPTQHPFVKNPDGGSSNVMMAGVGLEGKEYVIPTMVNGKQLSIEEAVEVARKAGLDKYPSFSTAKEADDFAQKNHGSIDENGYLRDPSGEGLSKVAAELSRAGGDIGAAQGLEGDMQATGGTFAGGVTRLGVGMAPMLLPGGAVGGIARLAGAGAGAATAAAVGASALTAGAQTAGSQFGEVYDHLRQQGKTHEQAFGVSRNAAVLSGAVTTALTALGGATGVESLLRQGGKELVKSRLVAALKAVPGGAAKEIAEELPDEYVSQLVSAFAKDPNASPSQVTDEFAANAPDLILQIAALGGAGSGVGRFKETTTDPTKTAQEQEFPAAGAPPDLSQRDRDNFAQGGVPIFDTEGNVTGYTAPRAAEATASTEDIRKAAEEAIKPGIPVEVNGVTIATINPESGWNVQDVLDFANSPEDMATLARNKIITLPEAVAPIEGVDPAITAEMNARFAEGKAAGDANQTLAELERQKAAQTVDTEADIPEAQIAPTVGETAAPEVDISADTETLGVTPPPAPALEAPEGAARNAEMLRQAAARAAGTEQGPRIGFTNPSVKLGLTPEESSATGAGMKEENKQTPRDTSKQGEALEAAKAQARAVEKMKREGKITSDDERYWSTPLKGQPKDPIPDVKDANGVQVKEGDVIEFGGVLGGVGRGTVHWSEPHIANASGEVQAGAWIGNGILDNMSRGFTIIERDGKPFNPQSVKPKPAPQTVSAVTAETETPGSATGAGMKEENQQTPSPAAEPVQVAGFSRKDIEAPAFDSLSDYAREGYLNGERITTGTAAGFISTPDTYFVDPSQMPKGSVMDSDLQGYAYPKSDGRVGYLHMDLDGVAKESTPPDDLASKVVESQKTKSPPAVTTETETPGSTANAAGGSQGVQTEPAEGSIPTVTEDTVSISDIPSTAEIQPEVRENPTPEEKAELEELDSLMERRGQAQNKVKGATFSKKDEARFQELGAKLRRFLFETVDAANDAVVGEDINGQPIRQSKNGTLYTVENGRVRTAPAFKPDPEYSRQQDELLAKQKAAPAVEEAPASEEWSPTPGQPATANINGQKVVGTVGPSTGKDLVSFQYEWNGKTQKATVRPDRLSRPVASLTEPPSYEYTQEQNTRKMGKHFPTAPGLYANHDFRKSFASMAEDTSLSRIYRQIAKVMSKMDAFANIDLHIVADGDIGYAGEYSHSNGKSSIAVNLRQVARGKVDALGTILHEALHHITLAKVRNPQGAFETEVVDKLDTIRKRVKEYAKQQGLGKRLGYELNTLEEFISALTSPDFQNFLASIPDSFSTGVSVGKFRSALSEVFRLIAELIKGEPVARGSAMEQYFTTVLALFETPHRTLDIGKLEKLSAVQSGVAQATPESLRHAELEAKFNAGTITPEETAEAQALVDERAKAAGYETEAWHGSGSGPFSTFRLSEVGGVFVALDKKEAENFATGKNASLRRFYVRGKYPERVHLSVDERVAANQAKRAGRDGIRVSDSDGWDRFANKPVERSVNLLVFDRNNIKSADPFTGVPLDQRFDKESNDIRASLAEQPERRGYRTPADMLAEAAQKAKGERATEKPQGLASMFKPQAKRPATGERKLLDMPVRNTLANAYREAVRGSSTQMAPLSSVYAQARLLQPGLTPEAFLAQVQEGYDNGTLLLEGAGSQQEADAAGLWLPGTPVGTAVRMMPAPETPKSLVYEETDAAYMAAVEAGDMETAQRMVDEAAKAAGYDREAFKAMPEKDWRTDEPINVIKSTNGPWAGFFTDAKEVADRFGRIMRQPVRRAFLKLSKPFEVDASGKAAGELQFDILDDSGPYAQKNNAEILAAINSGKYDGIVLRNTTDEGTVIVPIDPSQIKSADPVTYDESGAVIPLSQRFNPESPSILYAAPIDTSTLPTRDPASGENVPDREAGSSENAETVSQRLESRRKEAISAAVVENDWGNYTREQKVAAAESFLAKWVVSFSAMEFPADVRFSVEVGDGSGAHVSVHEVPSRPLGIRVSVGQNRGLDKYANLSPTEVFAHLYDTAQEESIHVAQYLGMHRDWLETREQGFKGTFLSYIGQKLKDTFDQINKARIDLQQTDSAAAEKIKDAMLASWNIYHFNDRVEGIAGLWSRLEGDPSRQGDFIMEMVRQLTQLKRQDFTTETGWQKFRRVLEKWLTDAINSLRGVQDVFRSGMAGDLIQRQLADLEAALEGKPLPPVSRGTPKSVVEEPDQRESDAILGAMMEDGRFEEGVKMYDKAKRANLGAPPQPSPNTSTPPRFTSPAQFAAAFEAAFLRGDYDYFLEALKQADRHIYVPEMKRYINASKLGDTDAAERLEWFRHAIAGTIPTNVKPQAKAPPQPASVRAPTTPPPPTWCHPPRLACPTVRC
jgi:hypothetical protein